jgi:hypothetical protein
MDSHLSYGATMTLSNGDDSLKCAGLEIIESPRGGVPRSGEHGLNGFYGSLGCEGSVQALVGESFGFFVNNKDVVVVHAAAMRGAMFPTPQLSDP